MSEPRDQDRASNHPTVREHPEQGRQEETGREDASEASEVGRPQPESHEPTGAPSKTRKPEEAA